jgi:hypothetical protein
MSIRVNFPNGGVTDVQIAGRSRVTAVLPLAAAFGSVGFVGALSLSYEFEDVSVTGIVTDAGGSRPFKLDMNESEVEAVDRTSRARLVLDATHGRTLTLFGRELTGSKWQDAAPQAVMSW